MQNLLKQCIVCRQPTNQCCSKCQKTFYCSRIHQQQHWSQHKFECEGRLKNILTPTNRLGQSKITQQIVKNNNSEEEKQKQLSSTIQKIMIKDQQQHSTKQIIEQKYESRKSNNKIVQFLQISQLRKECRKKLIFESVKGRQQFIKTKCKILLNISRKIYMQYEDQINQNLLKTLKIRTSKLLQNLQYLLDVSYVAKLYLKFQFRQALKQLLFSLKLPDIPIKIEIINKIESEIQKYILWKQQVQQYKSCLILIAAISNAAGLTSYSQNIYKQYTILVQRSYGINQLFLTYYMIALWYTEIGQYKKANKCFQYCISLNTSNNFEVPVSDCYYNLALNLRMQNQIVQAIDKMHNSLLIRRAKLGKNCIEVSYCLEFIGKQFIQLQDYSQSIDYLNQCYNIRKSILKASDQALIYIIDLIKNLYNFIKEKKQNQQKRINISEVQQLENVMQKLQNQCQLVRLNSQHYQKRIQVQQKTAKKLNKIEIDPEWFESLEYKDLQNLANLIKNSDLLPKQQAIIYVLQSQFFKKLSEEMKIRFKQLNPQFR